MTRALPGLAVGMVGIGWAFRSGWSSFWTRMTLVTGLLGGYALIVHPELRRDRPQLGDVLTALLSAAGLYRIFQIGDRLARRIMPRGTAEIDRIYQLRQAAPPWLIALLLAAIIAPGEELFWRGLLQKTLMRRHGAARGTALAAACYGAAHLSSGNLTLVGAATTAGAFWGLQYLVQGRLPANVLSHILWDIWIFLIAPTAEVDRDDRA